MQRHRRIAECVSNTWVQQNALNSSTAAAAAARITALTNKAEAPKQPTQPASKNEENAINERSLWWSAGNGPDVPWGWYCITRVTRLF